MTKKRFVAKHKSNGDYVFNLDGLTTYPLQTSGVKASSQRW